MTGFYITPTVKWNGGKWFTQIKFQQKKSTSRITYLKQSNKPDTKGLASLLTITTSQFYQILPLYRNQSFDVHWIFTKNNKKFFFPLM